MVALKLEHISHSFGDLSVIEDMNLMVEEGELFCLLGPSGCGKTTILRLIAGLEELQFGCVKIGSRTVAEPTSAILPEARNIGFVFQDYGLFPHLKVLHNVTFGLQGYTDYLAEQRALEMLSKVRMSDQAHAYPHTLSGGQQQRVALARALAPGPNLVLMDEPFSNLDVRLREEVCNETFALLKQTGTSTLMVTHDPDQAMRMADRIAVMRQGVIQQIGSPEEIYAHPINSFTLKFFSEVNALDGISYAGEVETPFGPISAKGIGDGTEVDVLIRPEGLLLTNLTNSTSSNEPIDFKVLSTRTFGHHRQLQLELLSNKDIVLISRVAGLKIPEPGEMVSVMLDHDQSFAYPKTEENLLSEY